jgi:hypothetical protein
MTTALNLAPYQSIQQATFVKIQFTENGNPVIVRMSTYDVPFNITEDGGTFQYLPLGALLSISEFTNETKVSQSDVEITLSGIPEQYMSGIIANPIKGAPVEIRRAFFNAQTGQFLSISGNPVMEFRGIVSNFSIEEGWGDQNSQTVTTTITLSCSSIMSVLANKVTGRRTNKPSQNYWFNGDLAMDRVAVISDAVFDFGGTTPTTAPTTSAAKTIITG